MRKINDYGRVARLIRSIITDLDLDLTGIRVLTETGSGPFVFTPIIASMAGADKVIAVTRDSSYGSVSEVKFYTETWAREIGISNNILVSFEPPKSHAAESDLITNLGFVRPIDKEMISLLPRNAAVSLMWETWEYRAEDLDLAACKEYNIPVLGTNEQAQRLKIFQYIGMLVLKLLFEAGVEVFRTKTVVVGSGHFGIEAENALRNNGAETMRIDPLNSWGLNDQNIEEYMQNADALVIVEHQFKTTVLGGETGIPCNWLPKDIKVVHICGNIDDQELLNNGIIKIPAKKVRPGYMTVTTDYVGPKPVIDLHAAGLKVGESLIRGMQKYNDKEKAIAFALKHSPAMNFH